MTDPVSLLKPNTIIRSPIFPEPVQVFVVIPMGTSVKLIGKGSMLAILVARVKRRI